MQEELLALWTEVRFTLLFVTHSIEEALVVGNRIGLLSAQTGLRYVLQVLVPAALPAILWA